MPHNNGLDAQTNGWGERLSALKAALALTDDLLLASKLGVSPATLRAWVSGKRRPRGPTLKIVELLEAGAAKRRDWRRHSQEAETGSRVNPETLDYWAYLCLWYAYLRGKATMFYGSPRRYCQPAEDIQRLIRVREMLGTELQRFPLDRVAREADLSDDDLSMLASLVTARMIMPREPSGVRSSFNTTGGPFLLSVVCGSRLEIARKAALLSEGGRLISSELVKCSLRSRTLLNSCFTLTERAADQLLTGLPQSLLAATDLNDGDDDEYRLVKPRATFSDLVVSADVAERLRQALAFVRHRNVILEDWGFGRHIHYGRGLGLLFCGPPGTGKTLAAEAFAGELGKDLWVADCSGIVSKWEGDTDKHIARLFDSAGMADTVLLIDEADGLFASREMAMHSWQLRQVNCLLQGIERYEGVVILTTNNELALDRALERRLAAIIEFPRPGREEREALWRRLLPKEMPLAGDVDLSRLARLDLTGGEINKAVFAASAAALARGPDAAIVTHADIETAARFSLKPQARIGFGRCDRGQRHGEEVLA